MKYSMKYTNSENKQHNVNVASITDMVFRDCEFFDFVVRTFMLLITQEHSPFDEYKGNPDLSRDLAAIARSMHTYTDGKYSVNTNIDMRNRYVFILVNYTDQDGNAQYSSCVITCGK